MVIPGTNSAANDSEKEAENVIDIAKSDVLNDVPRQHQECELDQLISRLDEDRIGHVESFTKRIRKLSDNIKSNQQLPSTIGIFGGWGTGKTFILTNLARELREQNQRVVYFNAFSYAAFTDLTTSLVYRILRNSNPDSGFSKILHQVNQISRSHAKVLYKQAVLPAKLFRAGREFVSNVDSDRQLKIADNYFGKVDRIHQALARALKGISKEVIYVLVDELDRCDPEEAFSVLKQLRVLLTAPNLPLIFILSVNPEPIGRYVQKKFGWDGSDSYESLSLLEKFVDYSIQLPPHRDIEKYLEHRRIQLNLPERMFYPTVLSLQSRGGTESSLPPGMASLPMFSNLRLISKTIESLSYSTPRFNLYSHWVWELLKVSCPNLALTACKLADELEEITDRTLGVLALQIGSGNSRYHSQYSNPKANFFDFYCEIFRDQIIDLARRKSAVAQGAGVDKLLLELASNSISVYSLAHLTCVDVGSLQTKEFHNNGTGLRYTEMVLNASKPLAHFERMLLPSGNKI